MNFLSIGWISKLDKPTLQLLFQNCIRTDNIIQQLNKTWWLDFKTREGNTI